MKILLKFTFIFAATIFLGSCTYPENSNISNTETAEKTPPPQQDFDNLSNHLNQYIATGNLAGVSALVLRKGQPIFDKKYGVQNLETQNPITDQTIFRLASLTKPIVSVGILKLMEERQLQLDDPVEKYLPFFKDVVVFDTQKTPQNKMTIRQLLTHTSGISSAFEQDEVGQMFRDLTGKIGATNLEEYVQAIAKIPLGSEPGTKFMYSHSTDVLALIIEKISQKRVDEFLKTKIFEPLGMTKTGYLVHADDLKNFASLYTLDEQNQLQMIDKNSESKYVTGSFPRGNTGMVSTISDYAKFAQMLTNQGIINDKRILNTETVQLFSKNHLTESQLPVAAGPMHFEGLGFGLGVAISDGTSPLGVVDGTYGWIGATHTYCFIDPKNEIVSLVFTQLGSQKPCPILFEFSELVYEGI